MEALRSGVGLVPLGQGAALVTDQRGPDRMPQPEQWLSEHGWWIAAGCFAGCVIGIALHQIGWLL